MNEALEQIFFVGVLILIWTGVMCFRSLIRFRKRGLKHGRIEEGPTFSAFDYFSGAFLGTGKSAITRGAWGSDPDLSDTVKEVEE